MARPLRIEWAGCWYHLTARGNERRAIFWDDADRSEFLGKVAETMARFRAQLHAFVLMDTHHHLLLQTLEANLSALMQWLNSQYCQGFNRQHRRAGLTKSGSDQALSILNEEGNFQNRVLLRLKRPFSRSIITAEVRRAQMHSRNRIVGALFGATPEMETWNLVLVWILEVWNLDFAFKWWT